MATASARLRAPTFVRKLVARRRTVTIETESRRAIAWSVRPFATSSMTSSSSGVNASRSDL